MDSTCDIVQLASLGKQFDARLAARFRILPWWNDEHRQEALSPRAGAARIAVTSVRYGISKAVMEQLPALQAVCSWGAGYDTLNMQAASERGLCVSNTPGVLDDCVADLAWALLLSTARRTHIGDRYVKTGQWRTRGTFPLSTKVSGKRLGILGLGRIGEAIARRATGFDMDVRYHNRQARTDTPYQYEHSLVELAKWSDFLVVACVGGPQTYHLVDGEVMCALGPQGVLLNISRGSVIDQMALIAVLSDGRLGGAGLDVFEDEPNVPFELMNMDRVCLMPHVGSATYETRAEMRDLVFDNVVSFHETGRLLTPVVYKARPDARLLPALPAD